MNTSTLETEPHNVENDLKLATAVIAGEAPAIEQFYQLYRPILQQCLFARADSQCGRNGVPEILDEVLAQCVAPIKTPRRNSGEAYCLLERYLRPVRSKVPPGPLLAWLRTVVTNRFVDWVTRNCPMGPRGDTDYADTRMDDDGSSPPDPEVTGILIAALRHGFHAAIEQKPLGVITLLLTVIHGVQGRQFAEILGVHPANVTVPKKLALEIMHSEAIAYIQRIDPLLDLTWEDVMGLLAKQQDLVATLFGNE